MYCCYLRKTKFSYDGFRELQSCVGKMILSYFSTDGTTQVLIFWFSFTTRESQVIPE